MFKKKSRKAIENRLCLKIDLKLSCDIANFEELISTISASSQYSCGRTCGPISFFFFDIETG